MPRKSIAERTIEAQITRIGIDINAAEQELQQCLTVVNTLTKQKQTLEVELQRLAQARNNAKP